MDKQFIQWSKAGGSILVRIPADAVRACNLRQTKGANFSVENGRLIFEPVKGEPVKRYTLDEILASCDLESPKSEEELEWENAPRAGLEEI